MRLLRVVNTGRDCELGTRVGLADAWLSRLRGMLGRPEPEPGEGLLLTPCQLGSHVRHALSARRGVPGSRAVSSWRRTVRSHQALEASGTEMPLHALELPAGTLESSGTTVGDVLTWAAQPAPAAGEFPGEARPFRERHTSHAERVTRLLGTTRRLRHPTHWPIPGCRSTRCVTSS